MDTAEHHDHPDVVRTRFPSADPPLVHYVDGMAPVREPMPAHFDGREDPHPEIKAEFGCDVPTHLESIGNNQYCYACLNLGL